MTLGKPIITINLEVPDRATMEARRTSVTEIEVIQVEIATYPSDKPKLHDRKKRSRAGDKLGITCKMMKR